MIRSRLRTIPLDRVIDRVLTRQLARFAARESIRDRIEERLTQQLGRHGLLGHVTNHMEQLQTTRARQLAEQVTRVSLI